MSGSPVGDGGVGELVAVGGPGGRLVDAAAGREADQRPRRSEYILIWKPSGPSEVKARRELSGETRGESEMVPRWVTGCWLAPS